MTTQLIEAAAAAVRELAEAGLTLATAESCTGGLIAAALTSVPGASAVLRFGWVTYCNQAKQEQLGVPAETIAAHTVVSGPVVQAMAEGALTRAHADIAVAVSGNAGPTAAEGEPTVGTVCIGLALRGAPSTAETVFRPGLERNEFRTMVALRALELVREQAQRIRR